MVKKAGGALLLTIHLDRSDRRPLGVQLSAALREAILSGGLRPGERLPATRTIAQDLAVSRTTVLEAFDRLVSEGLAESRTGAGTFVSKALDAHRPIGPAAAGDRVPSVAPARRLADIVAHGSQSFFERPAHPRRAFTTALPAFDAFPMALWAQHVARHWRAHRDVVLGHGDPRGYLPLRRTIAAHLRVNRGIACEAEQIFIVNGAQHGFQLIASIVLNPGDAVWFENPGAIGARNCFIAAGARLCPVPVDEDGLVVEEGMRMSADFRLAFVTPSHQQPLCSTMSLTRRLALLNAAEQADAWIVEDDYDGEFCYRGRSPPTLKAIDVAGRVIYVGTFSKTLFPALRLGYVLVPPALREVFERFLRAFSPGASPNSQAVVAGFMEEGHFSAHIRRMRKLYAERHDALRAAAAERLSGLLEVMETNTGLHTIGRLPPGKSEAGIAERAWKRDLTVAPIGMYSIRPVAIQGLVLGFSGIRSDEIRRAVNVLGEVLENS
jgi:GntR family transcriptional regulator/MocR family aminotransferase